MHNNPEKLSTCGVHDSGAARAKWVIRGRSDASKSFTRSEASESGHCWTWAATDSFRYFHETGAESLQSIIWAPAAGCLEDADGTGSRALRARGVDPLPLADSSIDVVFAGNVIEHFVNFIKPFSRIETGADPADGWSWIQKRGGFEDAAEDPGV
jgi:hypothetical protein